MFTHGLAATSAQNIPRVGHRPEVRQPVRVRDAADRLHEPVRDVDGHDRADPLLVVGEHESFVHSDDVAGATLAAIERRRRGVYNIVDEEPAATSEWLPYLAEVLGAKPPRHVPEWAGRLVAGEQVVSMMTEARGASNAKAKRELGWTLVHPTWRDGFVSVLTPEQVRSAA